jgi:hypothetical protein
MESSGTWNGELWYLVWRVLVSGMESSGTVPGMESSGSWDGELWYLEWGALVPGMASSGTWDGELWNVAE